MTSKTYSAVMEDLYVMLDFVIGEARKLDFDEDDLFKIELATEEALVNIIRYGYPQGEDGKIKITCTIKDNKMRIQVMDWGAPFDPLKHVSNVNLTEGIEERLSGGLGIFLILNVMDEVNYKSKEGGNVLTLIKEAPNSITT